MILEIPQNIEKIDGIITAQTDRPIARLDPLEFQKTARLSFESRNWSAQRPIDIRMNENVQFELCGQIHGRIDEHEIVRAVEEAGGEILYKDR